MRADGCAESARFFGAKSSARTRWLRQSHRRPFPRLGGLLSEAAATIGWTLRIRTRRARSSMWWVPGRCMSEDSRISENRPPLLDADFLAVRRLPHGVLVPSLLPEPRDVLYNTYSACGTKKKANLTPWRRRFVRGWRRLAARAVASIDAVGVEYRGNCGAMSN